MPTYVFKLNREINSTDANLPRNRDQYVLEAPPITRSMVTPSYLCYPYLERRQASKVSKNQARRMTTNAEASMDVEIVALAATRLDAYSRVTA